MANKVLDFLGGAVHSVVDPIGQAATSISATPLGYLMPGGRPQDRIESIAKSLPNQEAQDAFRSQAYSSLLSNSGFGMNDTPGQIGRKFVGNAAQVVLDVAAPGIGKAVSRVASPVIGAAADVGGNVAGRVGSKIATGAARGAIENSVLGGAFNTAQGIGSKQPLNVKNLFLDFLQGAGLGATQGAVFGGATNRLSPFKATDMSVPGSILFRKAAQFTKAALAGDSNAVEGYTHSSELVKDYADMLKDQDTGVPGGELTPTHNPTGAPEYTRTSAHSPFYRQVYADTGKPPTNGAWQDEAERQLASGHGAYGASDIYNQLKGRERSAPLLDTETAADIAKSKDPAVIEKKLTPVVGPAVAHDVAPSLAHTAASDPNVVQRMVQNDIVKKLPSEQTSLPGMPSQLPLIYEQLAGKGETASDVKARIDAQVAADQQKAAALQANPPAQNGELQSLDRQYAGLTDKERGIYTPDAAAFLNKPGEQPAGISHVSRLDATTKLSEDLNTGIPVSEALTNYMDSIGASRAEANKAYLDITGGGAVDKSKINETLNPEYKRVSTMLPTAQAGDIDRPALNSQVVHNELNRLATVAMDTGNKLTANDLKLMQTFHGKTLEQLLPQAENKQAFTDAFNALKKYDDTKQALGAGQFSVQAPYRQNHGLTMRWKNESNQVEAAKQHIAMNSLTPGYTGPRTIENYQVGMELGLTPKNDNIYQDLKDDLAQSQSSLSRLAYQKALEEAFPGQIESGVLPVSQQGVWKQLTTPYGNRLFAPADIANRINERAPAPEANGLWKGYDALNGSWKNLKLGAGGFHALNTMGNWFSQQLASGNIFTHPEDSAGVLRSLFDEKFVSDTIRQWDSTGATLKEDQAGLNAHIGGTEADIKPSGKLANIPILKQIHEAVFGRQIPFMMKAEFHQDTEGLDFTKPEDLEQAKNIAKSINQRYGSFNRAIQGFSPTVARNLGRGILAVGWNEGQIRTLVDAFSKGGIEGKLARQTVFGKALIFGALATLGGVAGGEFKGQDPKQVAFNILQKTINPSFKFGNYTVGLPATQVSEVGKPVSQTIGNAFSGGSLVNPTKDMLSARLAAVPSGVEQIAGNRNFSGNPIVGSDYYGRPISPVQTAAEVAGMAAPIPVAQGLQTGTGQQNLAAGIANTAGLSARPMYDLSYAPIAGQTYVAALKQAGAPQQQLDADTQFYDLLGTLSKARKSALNKAIGDIGKKNPAQAQKDIAAYNTKLGQTLQPWIQAGGTKYLDPTMIQQLQSSRITLSGASRNARTDIKSNPTAYGLPLSASSLNTQAQQAAGAFTNAKP